MSRIEQRNLAVFVALVGGLLVGGALLANYSGILRADAQEQPKVGCAGEGKACGVTTNEAAGFPAVHASVDAVASGGCCSAEKAAGCDDCGDKGAGCDDCGGKDGACDDCGGKDGGCDDGGCGDGGCGDGGCGNETAGCDHEPKAGGCCSAK